MSWFHVLDKLDDYIADTLSARQRQRVDAHLRQCPDCARKLVVLRRVKELLLTLPVPAVAPDLADRAMAKIAQDTLPEKPTKHMMPVRALAWSVATVLLLTIGAIWVSKPEWLGKRNRTEIASPVIAPAGNSVIPPGEPLPPASATQSNPIKAPHIEPKTVTPQVLAQAEAPALIAMALPLGSTATRSPGTAAAVTLDTQCITEIVAKLSETLSETPIIESKIYQEGLAVRPVVLQGILSPTAQEVFTQQLRQALADARLMKKGRGVPQYAAQATLSLAENDVYSWRLEVVQESAGAAVCAVELPCSPTPAPATTTNSPATVAWLITQIETHTLDTAAAELLVQAGQPAALPVLAAFQGSEERKVADTFAWVLGQLKDPAVLPQLLQALSGPHADEAADAIRGYGAVALPQLLNVLKQSTDARVRQRIVDLLGSLSEHDATAALGNALLHDENLDVRIAAARTLADNKDPMASTALVDSFRNPAFITPAQKTLREEVFIALQQQGPQAVPALTIALQYPDPNVRALAIDALKGITGEEAKEALRRYDQH
ncbi:MAG: HEAT repeat domain-containing protein [bacterium]